MRALSQARHTFRTWIAALGFCALAIPAAGVAQVSSTEPAAVVVFPYLVRDAERGEDTLIEIANTDPEAELLVRCFLEDNTPGCQATRTDPCVPRRIDEPCEERTCDDDPRGDDFVVRLTPEQPLSWWISQGRDEFPLDGSNSPATNNDGSSVPPVAALFSGLLRCVSVDDAGRPTDRNRLIGNATVRRMTETGPANGRYNAVGIAALEGAVDGDDILTFGGDDAEYNACPEMLDLPVFGGNAVVRAGTLESIVETTLSVVSCGQDTQADSVLQILLYNEFSQRFSTSRVLRGGQLVSRTTRLDAADTPERSIFSASVNGTLTLHIRLNAIARGEPGSTGILAVLVEEYSEQETGGIAIAALNAPTISLQRDRELFPLRLAACIGDCNVDRDVTIDELMVGVNISLGESGVDSCVAFDADVSESVTVDEVITGMTMGLEGCVVALPRLPALPEPEPDPPLPQPTSPGGQITILAVTQADGTPVPPVGVDEAGRPIYERPFGDGFILVFEARRGTNRSSLPDETFFSEGLPPLQMIVSRDLGDGSEAVCDLTGGVPATAPLVFGSSTQLEDAVNDLGCRAHAAPATQMPCTRLPVTLTDTPLTLTAEVQFCLPIARTWRFPLGDTIVAARVRDQSGAVGPVAEMVVRVLD